MEIRKKTDQYVSLFGNTPFRRLFSGRMISLIGDNIYQVAAMWLVFDITGSTFFTGVAAFLGRVPTTLSFLTGPIVDSRNPRTILVITELVQMVVILLVPLAATFGQLHIPVLLAVVLLVALSNQFSGPAQDAALPRIVNESHIVKANSLFTLTKRGAQAGSKAAAGFLISLIGAVTIFLLNAGTFILGAVVFSLVNVPDLETEEEDSDEKYENNRERLSKYFQKLAEGKRVITNSVIIYIVFGTAFANFLSGVSMAVLPAYAASLAAASNQLVSIAGSSTYGTLYAGVGLGLFIGATVASSFEEISFWLASLVLFLWAAIAWVSAIVVQSILLTVVLFTLAWVPIGIYNILAVSILQIGVPDSLLGRVMSTSASVSGLLTAGGVLLGGAAGEITSSGNVLLLSGFSFLLVGLYWLAIPSARSISSITEIDAGAFEIKSGNNT